MKNLFIHTLLFTMLFNCTVSDQVPSNNQEENNLTIVEYFDPSTSKFVYIETSNFEVDNIIDINTGITKMTLSSENSILMLIELINKAQSISDSKNSVNYLEFYFKDDELYITRDFDIQAGIVNNLDEKECGLWSNCKTCRSDGCEAEFILDIAAQNDCFQIYLDRNEFFSEIYSISCS